jgi:uncharacterized membrane protein
MIKHTLSWIPTDLVKPIFYLVISAFAIVGIHFIPFFHFRLQFTWWWLPWNLFLAGLPLLFSLGLIRAEHMKKRFYKLRIWFWGLLWLFFYPNSPYMLTNLINLSRLDFITHNDQYAYGFSYQFSSEIAVWFPFLHLVLGIIVGVTLGLVSLFIIHRHIEARLGTKYSWVLTTAVSALSGIAIWMGRILRFNSWDVIFRPFQLIQSIISAFDWNALWLCIIFAIMSGLVYLLLWMLLSNKYDNTKKYSYSQISD